MDKFNVSVSIPKKSSLYDYCEVKIPENNINYQVAPVNALYTGDYISKSGVVVKSPEQGQSLVKYRKYNTHLAYYDTPSFYRDVGDYDIYFTVSGDGLAKVDGAYKLNISAGTVTGKVIEKATGNAEYVHIELTNKVSGERYSAFTNSDTGIYVISPVVPGPYTFKASIGAWMTEESFDFVLDSSVVDLGTTVLTFIGYTFEFDGIVYSQFRNMLDCYVDGSLYATMPTGQTQISYHGKYIAKVSGANGKYFYVYDYDNNIDGWKFIHYLKPYAGATVVSGTEKIFGPDGNLIFTFDVPYTALEANQKYVLAQLENNVVTKINRIE